MSTRKSTRKKPNNLARTLTPSGPAPQLRRIKPNNKMVVSPGGGAIVISKQGKPPIIKVNEQ
jgi:hypothetical protein